ncbi:MAG: Polyhydroxyalkanoic acid synthase, partial [uncultured Nocardioides sp.]
GPDPQARPGDRSGGERGADRPVRRARGPASDASDAHRRRRAPRGLPLPSRSRRRRARRSRAARDAARRTRDLLRPPTRLLARRAPGHGRSAHLPRRVRPGVLPQPLARGRALGRRGPPRGDPRRARALRGTPGARRGLEPGRNLHAADRRGPARPPHRLADRRRLTGRRAQGPPRGARAAP